MRERQRKGRRRGGEGRRRGRDREERALGDLPMGPHST